MPKVTPEETPITEENVQPFDDPRIVTLNGVRDKKRCPFALTKAEQEKIKPGFSPRWARWGQFWADKGEGIDRTQEVLDLCEGSEVVRNEENKPIRRGQDLVLMSIPNIYIEAEEAETEAQKKAGEKNLHESMYEPGVYTSHEQLFDGADKEEVKRRAADNSIAMIRAGMIGPGSPTSGMSLASAERMYSDEQIKAEEAKWRSGGAHVQLTEEAWHEMLGATGDYRETDREAPKRTKTSVGYSKTYADNYDKAFAKKPTIAKR